MITFKSLFLLIEGYSEVKNRLISQNIPADVVTDALNFHRKYKNHFPENMRNIDTYFSKNNILKTGKTVDKMFDELREKSAEIQMTIPSTPVNNISRKDKIAQLIEKTKIAENNDYVLFKVSTQNEAKNLARPGKDNPYGWPAELPVTWCVAANSNDGKEAWDMYTFDGEIPFFFAFKKNAGWRKYDPEEKSLDFIAIRFFDKDFVKYTPTQNGDEEVEWPKTLPIDWKNIIINNGGGLDKEQWDFDSWLDYLKLDPNNKNIAKQYNVFDMFIHQQWFKYLDIYPEDKDLLKQYNVFETFDTYDWLRYLKKYPNDKYLVKQYNAFEKFDIYDWLHYLIKYPNDKELAKQYISFEKLDGGEWTRYLEVVPEDKELAKQYNAFEKFNNYNWLNYLEIFPEDKELAKQYISFEEFDDRKWILYLKMFPEDKELAKQYNAFEKFDGRRWMQYLKIFPKDKELAKQYNAFEKFDGNSWMGHLRDFPEDRELAKQYDAFGKFGSNEWIGHLKYFPKDKELAKRYNAFENFNSFDWREYLKYFPQDKELAKQYGFKK